ncbi:MAG: thioredoxin [Deltaproteobacteria bacterium]|nr:thioredoxin [Deltaproteobacteria bacterium]
MTNQVVHVTRETYDSEITRSDVPVVVDFWAPWCGPCRAIAPILDALAGQYAGKVKVAKINVDEEPEIAGAFQVQGIPTLVAVRDQQVVKQLVGFGGREPLEQLFSNLAETHVAEAK